MQSRLLLNVVVRKRTTIFELFTSEDKTLLVGWDTLLVLNLRLDIIDGVGRFNLQRDRLAGERLYEDLHTTTKAENEMEGRLLLNVVIRESPTVLELFASKDQALLVGRDAFLVLDLRLHIINSVGGLDLQRDRLARERLDENLHPTAKTEDEVEGRLLLDVIIRESTPVLELFAGEDQTLLIRGDPAQTMSHHGIFEREKVPTLPCLGF